MTEKVDEELKVRLIGKGGESKIQKQRTICRHFYLLYIPDKVTIL